MNFKRFEAAAVSVVRTEGGTAEASVHQEGEQQLLASLQDRYWHARAAAALSLGKARCTGSFEKILEVLSDGNLDVRMGGVFSLGLSRDPKAAPHLVRILKDDGSNARITSTAALAAGLLGDASVQGDLMDAALRARHQELRASATVALGFCGDERCLPALEAILNGSNENRDLQAMATWALARIAQRKPDTKLHGKTELEKVVLTLLGSRIREVRRTAASVLADFPSEKAAQALKNAAFRDDDALVRSYALLSLAWRARGGESLDARKFFPVAFEREKNLDARAYAIVAAGLSRQPEMEEWIAGQLAEGNNELRCAAALALGLGRFPTSSARIKPVLLGDKTPRELKRWCCVGIGLTGDRTLTPLLKTMLLFGADRAVTDADGTTYLRYFAAQALTLLGDPLAVPVLESTLADGNPYVKTAAAAGLGSLKSPTSIRVLIEELAREKSGDMRARLNSALGNVMIDPEIRDLLADLPRGFSVPSVKRFYLLFVLITLE